MPDLDPYEFSIQLDFTIAYGKIAYIQEKERRYLRLDVVPREEMKQVIATPQHRTYKFMGSKETPASWGDLIIECMNHFDRQANFCILLAKGEFGGEAITEQSILIKVASSLINVAAMNYERVLTATS